LAICALCEKDSELQLSHIIPKFVFSWHKKASSSMLRSGDEPNKRIQDGLKEHLLCYDCEQLFSSWEDKFAREIFRPLQDEDTGNTKIRYGEWALKFSASVSFRALYYLRNEGLDHFPQHLLKDVDLAIERWKAFLLQKAPHPDRFEQHLVPLDVIESHTHDSLSPFINRYITAAVDMDAVCSDSSAFVYVKLFKVLIFGHIKEDRKYWRNTIIHVKEGVIGEKLTYRLPDYVFDYINNKSNQLHAQGRHLSENQKAKISESFEKNKDNVLNTPIGRGMLYDIFHSGEEAFKPKE
jgi:hypothetical protein